MAKMIVQCASFKGKQVVREPIARPKRNGKTYKDATNGNKQRSRMRHEARAEWQQKSPHACGAFPV